MRFLSVLFVFAAISSCGSLKKEKSSNKPVVTDEAAKAHSASLSAVTIVRVPVGADGKELNDKAEMRLSNDSNISKDSVSANFLASKVPESVVDELDATTSTESFRGYRNWGFNSYYGNSYNWNYYVPTYYYSGYYYNWNYANTYNNCGGYNYYQYNSAYGYGYNGHGRAPGYGYGY
jgi:hypothetical protein